MSREVRRVPGNWQHPKRDNGSYYPLFDDYNFRRNEFDELENKEGLQYAIDYFGAKPHPVDYMPDWPESERTHYMMYECTTEGTPKSPAFETPEELARWLTDNNVSAFADMTASYEQWLRVCGGGYAPSMMSSGSDLVSGVEGMGGEE